MTRMDHTDHTVEMKMKKSLEILRVRLGKRASNFERTHGRPCGIADIRADKAWVRKEDEQAMFVT